MEQPLEDEFGDGIGEDDWDDSGEDFEDDVRHILRERIRWARFRWAGVRQDDFWNAFDAWYNANQYGINPNERNNHVRKMGRFMFCAGMGIAGSVSMMTMISDQPRNNRAIISDVIVPCSLFFAGSAGMIVGWFLMCCNNPGRYLYLANLAILPLAIGCVLAKVFG